MNWHCWSLWSDASQNDHLLFVINGLEMKRTRINRERLKDTFIRLAETESPSRHESELAALLAQIFSTELGAEVSFDDSSIETGSDSGNMIVRLEGSRPVKPLFFNAHLDTVEPCRSVKVSFINGVFKSQGDTILGADDKAAIAILIEVARILQEGQIEHGPLEFLFTVCEEIGLLGAKALDPAFLEADAGYALDSTDINKLFNRAPAAVRTEIRVFGKAAHAGINPEAGINAIQLAARALAGVPQGRIDELTTCNTGIIRGGTATNIVPDLVEIKGEVRSHDEKMLRKVQDKILAAFHKEIMEVRARNSSGKEAPPSLPRVESEVFNDYPLMRVPEDHPLVVTAKEAASQLGRSMESVATGGGSDANILNSKGKATVILGVGMQNVHSTEEYILLDDMTATAELVLQIIHNWHEK